MWTAALLLALAQDAPDPDRLEPGLSFRLFEADRPLERVAEPLPDEVPNLDERRASLWCETDEDFGPFEDRFVVVATAWLRVDEPGPHAFRITSDDGSWLEVDGERVVWNPGLHAPQARDGSIELDAGHRSLRLLYFENEGGAYLTLEWKPPGAADFERIPEDRLFTEAGVTRVVAPGPKRFSDQLGDLRPGDGLPLEACHPGWRVESMRPEGFEPQVGALCWLPDGRLGVATFEPRNDGVRLDEPNGTLWALSNLDGEAEEIVVEQVAEGLQHPLGLETVGEWVYVAERDAITRLRDGDGDGSYEVREVFADGWESDNYHHFTFGLARQGDLLHAALSTSIGGSELPEAPSIVGSNGPNPPNRGTWLRVSLEEDLAPSERVEYAAGGFRTPDSVLPLDDGTALIADNQGAWKPANRIDHARPGRFYGHYNETRRATENHPDGGAPALFADRVPQAPVVWLPEGEAANSPTEMVRIPTGPFAGQLLVGDVKLGGLRRVSLEPAGDSFQGAVFRCSQGFEGGVHRLLWAPDGSLVVGMTGETATWSWRGTTFGLQRLVPTGEVPFELHSARVTARGLRLRLTGALDRERLPGADAFEARQWTYVASPEYGGSKREEEPLEVTEVVASQDGTELELAIPGMRTGRVLWLRAPLVSSDGEPLWSPECWVTVNVIPGRVELPPEREDAVLVYSRTAGFRHASIEDGVAALTELGAELGLRVDATEDPERFCDRELARYRAVVFLSTTGDALDLAQEAAFERFVRAGGGFFGIHAAADTEYDWPFYREVCGAAFRSHPAVQEALLHVVDRDHPCTRHLGESWTRRDEWYDFRASPAPAFRVLLELDEGTYAGGAMGSGPGDHPIAWCRELGSARVLYTGGGHTRESFAEPEFRAHLAGALAWVCGIAEDGKQPATSDS